MSRHVWGASLAADRVMAEVSGLPPERAANRLFIVFQAFIDESFQENGVFVLGGYVATAEAWARLSGEWDKLLSSGWGIPREDGRPHFKMNEMAVNEERMKRVPIFYRVIEDHVIGWVSARVEIPAIKRAISRIVVPDVPVRWNPILINPYYASFRALMDWFHSNRHLMTDAFSDQKIDFYFDNKVEKKPILEQWDRYIAGRPDEYRKYYGATPQFKDDMDFLPLQAADFWAWWVRKWHTEGTLERIVHPDFDTFKPRKGRKFFVVDVSSSEEQLIEVYVKLLRAELDPKYQIFVR